MDNSENISVKNQKKKEKIKNIIIVFLLILLVLTFFSNTIMNYSLPQVSVSRLSYGVVVKASEVSAVAESNQEYSVIAENDAEIKRTAVKTGQSVKEGQILFYLKSAEESEEAVMLKEAIDAAKLEHAKNLMIAGKDYFELNQAVSRARDELNAAIAARNSYDPGASSSISARLGELRKKQNELKNDIDALESGLYSDLSDSSKNIIGRDNLDAYLKAKKEYESVLGQIEELEKNYPGDQAWTSAQRNLSELQTILKRLKEDGADKREIEDAQTKADYASDDFDAINSVKDKISETKTLLSQKEADYKSKSGTETAILSLKSKLSAESESIAAEIESIEASNPGPDITDPDILNKNVSEAQYALDAAVHALEAQIKSDSLEDSKVNLDLDAESKKIEEDEAKYAKLIENSSKTEVVSPVSGVVSEIQALSGTAVSKGEPMMSICIEESGFIAKATVKNDLSHSLNVGKTYSVKDYADTSVRLSKITKNKQDSRSSDLEFDIIGDIESGAAITIMLSEESGRYDNVIPKNAVKEDSSGKFVYVVRSKSTPIGNRYIAKKIPVSVVAEDDSQCAVSGDLGSDSDYIITASSKPFTSGSQVRIEEG